SLPDGFCRNFFFYNRHKLGDLAKATYQALKYSLKKLGIHSFGAIINIHTFLYDINRFLYHILLLYIILFYFIL
ncbi:MAG: hypothetical protein ACRC5F_09935, partial [Cetobacterium sp.]